VLNLIIKRINSNRVKLIHGNTGVVTTNIPVDLFVTGIKIKSSDQEVNAHYIKQSRLSRKF